MILSFNYNGCRIQLFKIFSDTLDSVVQMHSHAKNGYEIHYIARGKGVLETEKDRYDIKKILSMLQVQMCSTNNFPVRMPRCLKSVFI